jgi:hypothetical protein
MSFVKLYKRDNVVYIEFVLDLYASEQPVEHSELVRIVETINEYSENMNQILIIDIEKCKRILEIDMVVFAKETRELSAQLGPKGHLVEIQILNANTIVKSIIRGLKLVIPTGLKEMIKCHASYKRE